MSIGCSENLYKALTQSNENVYSSGEYVPFTTSLLLLSSISLNQNEKHF